MLDTMWQFRSEYLPAREITLPTIDDYGRDLALFRVSFHEVEYRFFFSLFLGGMAFFS